jgi:Ran GTPase-activating protein (RanGAP) involved in mRNA processing and transport
MQYPIYDRYRYRFVADDVDCVEPSSSQLTDEWGHNNIVQVINPLDNPSEPKPIPSEINLRNANLCDDGAWAVFGGVQPSSAIEVLDLSNNNISDDGLMAIAVGCKALLKLKELRLNGNGFTFQGCKHLEPVIRDSATLTTLELSNNRLGDDGAECIGQFLEHHPSVTALYLDSNFINYDGCEHLGTSMHTMRNLRILSLAGNLIRTPAAERLSFHLRINGGVTTLNLSKNPLGPDGVACIGELMYESANLTSIDLSSTQMMLQEKKTGLISLCSGIRKNRSVGVLKLKNNGINNDNILDIAYALHQNRVITELDLEFNQLATQWFQPNSYLKTKLLAKMPTITTTLDRNRSIQGNPELYARYIHQPKEWPEDPGGEWNNKRKWKIEKKKGGKGKHNVAAALDPGIEGERKRLEEEYIKAELFKYSVAIGSFQRSEEGMRLIKHIAKAMKHYIHALSLDHAKQPEWMDGSHLAVLTAMLTYHIHEIDPPKEGGVLVEGENGAEVQVIPPLVEEELIQFVSKDRLRPLFKTLGIHISNEDLENFQAELMFNGVPDTLAIRKLCKKMKNNSQDYIAQMSKVTRVINKQMLRPPLEAAKHLLYEQGLRYKRISLRNYYRSRPLQDPRYLCVQCGRRFESDRLLRRHDEKKKKEHSRLALMEELYASQCHVIRRAKFLLTGVFFPAYYELNNTLLLPRYYCPQVFDTWGEDGRPVAVIEPDMTYQVEDMMGNWLQV